MKRPWRSNHTAGCVAAALAQLVCTPADADSGVGVDTSLSNALNTPPRRLLLPRDPDGMGITEWPRSPTGLLNAQPAVARPDATAAGDWLYSLSTEFGVLGGQGNTRNALFGMYRDNRNGLVLGNVRLVAEQPKSAAFVEVQAGSLGRRDQFSGVQFGRYNDWKVKLFYNETEHVFTDTFKSFWGGVATGNLTLPTGIPPAAGATCANPPACTNFTAPAYGLTTPTAQAAVNVAVAKGLYNSVTAAGNSELALVRKKGGARLDMVLSDHWKAFASGTLEKRQGARPFGATWAAGGGAGNIETVEPIDYDTHDFAAGLQYADDISALNVAFSGSFFRNNINTLTFQNPYLPATANGISGAQFTTGTIDLYPNNDFYNLKAEYARRLPDVYNARLTGVVSASSLRQNDALIAPAVVAGINAGVAGGNWDGTASLSRQRANARIDTRLVDLGMALAPMTGLDVRGKLRYYETRNSTDYTACNAITGQFGRLVNDGTGSALVNFTNSNGSALSAAQAAALNAFTAGNGCNISALQNYVAANNLAPNAGNLQIRDVPYDYRQLNVGLSADYRLGRNRTLTGDLQEEIYHRRFRERDRTTEDKAKLTYVDRSLEGGTLRVSAELANRRGSAYNTDPTSLEFYSYAFGIPSAAGSAAALPNWFHNNDQFRKFDLADRHQGIVNARFNYALRPDLDAGMNLQLKDARYPDSEYGRNGHLRQNTFNVDLNWQPSTQTSATAYFHLQNSSSRQSSIWPNACALGSTYYFYSNGQVLASTAGAAPPATPAGASLLATQMVNNANYAGVCGNASPTSPLYPTSRGWTVAQHDRNDVLGLGISHDFGRPQLSVDYTYTRGRTRVDYGYNASALGLTAAQVAVAGTGFPDLTFKQSVLNASLLMPVNKQVSLRLMWAYEWGKVFDWHYDGVAANPTGGAGSGYNVNMLYLDTGPQNYHVNLFGLMLKVDL